jgi:hypothetical protein
MDGQGSCCNLMDCGQTQSPMVGDHYEVKVDGEWMPVPRDTIYNVVAPWWCSRLRSATDRPQQGRDILRHPPIGLARADEVIE